MSEIYYLASPYSKYIDGPDAAHRVACEAAALLLKNAISVYSPVAHTHPIAVYGDIDLFDHELWLKVDKHFMDVCRGIIVLKASGWDRSVGVKYEIEEFASKLRPCYYMEVGQVPEILKP